MATPEAQARQQMDAALAASGWLVQDYKALNLGAGQGIAIREVPLKSGRCDYLLLVDRRPVGVIEAKKQGVTLSTVTDQSAHYAPNLYASAEYRRLLPAGFSPAIRTVCAWSRVKSSLRRSQPRHRPVNVHGTATRVF